jgi:hypothetical protein
VFAEISIEESVRRADAEHRRGQDQFRHGHGHGGRFIPPEAIRALADTTPERAGSGTGSSAMAAPGTDGEGTHRADPASEVRILMSELPEVTPDPTEGAPDPGQPKAGSRAQAGTEVVRMAISVSQLTAHPGNVREDLELTPEFCASIASEGVRVPLLVPRPPTALTGSSRGIAAWPPPPRLGWRRSRATWTRAAPG